MLYQSKISIRTISQYNYRKNENRWRPLKYLKKDLHIVLLLKFVEKCIATPCKIHYMLTANNRWEELEDRRQVSDPWTMLSINSCKVIHFSPEGRVFPWNMVSAKRYFIYFMIFCYLMYHYPVHKMSYHYMFTVEWFIERMICN